MKEIVESFLDETERIAKSVIEKVERVVDQTDDGKFDGDDVAAIANRVKEGVQGIIEQHDEDGVQWIGAKELEESEFLLTKFVQIVKRDDFADEKSGKGSVGFEGDYDGYRVVHIFDDSVEKFGLTFYPDASEEFYFVDPCDERHYISLDEYFLYLKKARVNELKDIAQKLGAKKYRITFKEEKISFSDKKKDFFAKADKNASDEFAYKKYTGIVIEAEGCFAESLPTRPEVKYLQYDSEIHELIEMRMNGESSLKKERYMIYSRQASDMKERDAVNIDRILEELKREGNATVAGEIENENRRFFEYELEF